MQELPDTSGGASSSNGEFDDSGGLLQNNSWQQVAVPTRVQTYTKVAISIQKLGSVGRYIDVSSFKNYVELCSQIEKMFGLEGLEIEEQSGCSGTKRKTPLASVNLATHISSEAYGALKDQTKVGLAQVNTDFRVFTPILADFLVAHPILDDSPLVKKVNNFLKDPYDFEIDQRVI
ncbi:hypothetical protein L2E82_31327 [Cichorium intybus]|uniref:Uncharacterized protein n=1 Tax=Cichorium intybus TaxID=13427 RepID=A0ACB9D375_CICIN|nr:hypothetical protein L2E82_31327 [Cichorium intybus]